MADTLGSAAVKTDAWHHRADAITSVAAFIGISIAVIGGRGLRAGGRLGGALRLHADRATMAGTCCSPR